METGRNIGRDLRLFRLLAPNLVELREQIPIDIDEETGEIVYPSPFDVTQIVVDRCAEVLDRSGLVSNVKRLIAEFIYRESQASTVVGKGYAIPHVRSKNVKDLTMCFLRYPESAPMKGAMAAEKVHYVFGIITPIYEEDTDYQKVYRKLLNIIKKDESFTIALSEMSDPGEIVPILKTRE